MPEEPIIELFEEPKPKEGTREGKEVAQEGFNFQASVSFTSLFINLFTISYWLQLLFYLMDYISFSYSFFLGFII